MLEHADQDRWSVRELRDQVIRVRRDRGERRGRPAVRPEDRQLAVLEKSVRRSTEALRALDGGTLDEAARAAVGEMARAFGRLSAGLEQLGQWREEGHA